MNHNSTEVHYNAEIDDNTEFHYGNEVPAPKKGAMSIPELSFELDVTTKTLYLAIKRGDIRAFRIGRVWRVGVEEVSRIKRGAIIRT